VLSSINIVEHELYFFVSCPGETLRGRTKKKTTKNTNQKYTQKEAICELLVYHTEYWLYISSSHCRGGLCR